MEPERYKKNLQGVLQLAIANSNTEDALDTTKSEQMEADRKQFLENALKSMTVDVVEELEKAIITLQSENSEAEDKIEALNVVRDYAGHIDFANNFISIGGSSVLLDCLRESHVKLKICAAYVIAELSQNNPYCQQHFVNTEALKLLMLYSKEDGDLANSSMHAISSLVRNFEEGTAKFIEMGGLDCIVNGLQTKHSNVFVKSCFLLRALASEHASIRDKFIEKGAVQKLATFLDPVCGFDVRTETVLSALDVLTQSEEGKRSLQSTDIAEVLQNLVELNQGKPECEEILRDSAVLLGHFGK